MKLHRLLSGIVFCLTAEPAFTFESDIHYAATYVLARASGFPVDAAAHIASANQGVDENLSTVAALEYENTSSTTGAFSLSRSHQAQKNFRLHCFSVTADSLGTVSADVWDRTASLTDRLGISGNPTSTAINHYKLGVALHCLQDSYSHNGYGGTCVGYPGSCSGHAYDSALDSFEYYLAGITTRVNPDNPAKNQQSLKNTLQETANLLADYARKFGLKTYNISPEQIQNLSNLLNKIASKYSNADRRRCNEYLAGGWLREFLSKTEIPITEASTSPPMGLSECTASGGSLALPAPQYPQLDSQGNVVMDGTLPKFLTSSLLSEALDAVFPVLVHDAVWDTRTGSITYKIRIETSGPWQAPIATYLRFALVPQDTSMPPFTGQVKLGVNTTGELGKTVQFTNGNYQTYAIMAEIVSSPDDPRPWIYNGHPNAKLSCIVPGFTKGLFPEDTKRYASCRSPSLRVAPTTSTLSSPPSSPSTLSVTPTN